MNEEELRENLIEEYMSIAREFFYEGSSEKYEREKYAPEFADKMLALIRTEVLNTEKAYGGCHNCFGKGYATANEFASGRGVKWRISNMRFCKCDRGKQLKEMFELAQLKARQDEIALFFQRFERSEDIDSTPSDLVTGDVWLDGEDDDSIAYFDERLAQLQANQKGKNND